MQTAAAAAVMLCIMLLDENTMISEAADIKLNSNAKVRSEASTSSNVVGNAAGGTTLSLLGETTGGDGYVWYQVSVNGATGYIRSDLAEKISGNMTQAEVERENSYTETSATVSAASVSSGKIAVDSANVRKGPSSTDAPVTSVKSGTEVTINGEAIGSDGKVWYQITVNGKTGFVRSDLIKAEESEEAEEPQEEEDSQEEADVEEESADEDFEEAETTEISNVISSRILPADVDLEEMTIDEALLEEWESGNYYVLYTKDSKGKDAWYLYSLEKNQFEKINSLQGNDKNTESSLGEGLFDGNNKIILLIAAALFILLVIVCIVLALKLHEYRVYYEDDEDEDDENDDEDEEDDEDEDDEDEEDDEDDDEEERPVRKPRWSPKNFLSRREEEDDEEEDDEDEDEADDEYLDDDDFEFEFLNMDGKDKF